MNSPEQSTLGRATVYAQRYDPGLLYPLERQTKRDELGLSRLPNGASALPFMGADIWNLYELSWLNAKGKPQVALARLVIACESPFIIESKSMKLYLNSFGQTRFANSQEVKEKIVQDISRAVWQVLEDGATSVRLTPPSIVLEMIDAKDFHLQKIQELAGVDLDRLDIECDVYQPAPHLLTAQFDQAPVSEVLCSQLLKSNCLVTGQPDWGSIRIAYTGPAIDQAALLAYLISFREHHEFHEQCVERVFMDIWTRCKPTKLTVYARYTRRGGLDINPFRTSHPQALPTLHRTARQ
ncbi:MAG: NADPH-dependent 7-cyano-7-deazaguanine reductase QueF [Betaproteobacteria bacterium]|jgi:7-cyano-7-deazaguanine reductase